MADFSKQWCEKNQEQGIKPDFDIIEVAKDLKNEYYIPYICEGFGFTAIGRSVDSEIVLFFPDGDADEDGVYGNWKKLEEII